MVCFFSHTSLSGREEVWVGGRSRVDPTDDREQLELWCAWDEQRGYERIRPLVLFGSPVPERAAQTGQNATVEPLDRPNALDGLIRCR